MTVPLSPDPSSARGEGRSCVADATFTLAVRLRDGQAGQIVLMNVERQRIGANRLDGRCRCSQRITPFDQDLCSDQASSTGTAFAMDCYFLAGVEQLVHGLSLRRPGNRKCFFRRMIVFDRQVKPLQTEFRTEISHVRHGIAGHFGTRHQRDYGVGTGRFQLFECNGQFHPFGSWARGQNQACAVIAKWQQIVGMVGHGRMRMNG